ncbi:MAG: methyl-accepting chemotaxis protein [Lachnospiraceae bacterium]|nr:methyl-accepting chemotaxis protein [Lachnospiraceae bacterium]
MKSIKTKIISSIILCALLSSAIIGILSISDSRRVSNEGAELALSLTAKNSSTEINALIATIEQSVDTLSNIALGNLDFSKFKNNDSYVAQYTDSIMSDVLNFAQNTSGTISAYIRYNPEFTDPTSGIFYIRDNLSAPFESITPTDFTMYDKTDTAHVGWYYIPVENGAPMWMEPYLNENVNIYMISYVVPLFVDGTSVGIIGMDIDFSELTQSLNKDNIFGNSSAFLYNAEGTIMYHPTLDTGTDISSVDNGALSSLKEELVNAGSTEILHHYTYEGTPKTLASYPLDNGMYLALTTSDQQIRADADQLSKQIFSVFIVGIIICIILGIFMGRNIANPIRQITDIIKQTANFDFQKSSNGNRLVKRKDETGVMAQAVSEMRSSFRQMLSDMNQVEQTILSDVNRLEEIMKENNMVSEDNSATTQQLAAGMEETTASASLIADNVNTIKGSAEDIKSLSEKGQTDSKEVKNRAQLLRDTTTSSTNKALDIYETMKLKTKEAVERSKAVEKINALTNDIKQISTQTNLLALNASIEAARAGDAGRGFGVVATEIGALASQTFQTVDGINEIVTEVNNAVTSMTDCILTIMDFLEKTVVSDYTSLKDIGEKYETDANSFADAMMQINSEITVLYQKINAIAEAIDNVNDTINQSAEGVSLIAEKSSSTAAKTAEGYNLVQESKESVALLREIIGKFQV